MNVLVLTSQFYAPSGAEGLQVEFAKELVSRSVDGVSVTLMAIGSVLDHRVASAKAELEASGLRVEMLNLRPHPGPLSLWAAASWLRKWIISEKINIIETSLYTPSIVASLATVGLHVTIVHGVHAPFYKNMKLGRFNLKKHFWRLVLNRKCIFFYSISDFVGNCWKDFFNVSTDRIRNIYNSISDCHFRAVSCRETIAEELGISVDEKLVLFVGRIRPDKGVDLLLDAMENELVNLQAHLVFIGDVEPEYASLGKRLAELANQPESRIHHLGYRPDVPSWFASSDVFVLPTQREGFGMVIMEALAGGCPTVATTVDALPEVFGESVACLVARDDIEALKGAIKKQLSLDLETRKTIAEGGRSFAADFTTKRRTDELLEYMVFCQNRM